MAYELKRRGFHNIVIFESRHEVGGKTTSRLYRNVWHDLGTINLAVTYDKTVALLEKFNTGFDIIPNPPSSIWNNRHEFNSAFEAFSVSLPKLLEASERYIALHRCFFGTYDGELMPRPSPDILYRVRGTIDDFLVRYNLTDLRPLFFIGFVVNAYGSLNETSALYALTFVPPAVVRSFLRPDRGLYRLRGGWQNLCREISRRINVEIRFNVNIKHIHRENGIRILFQEKHFPSLHVDNFDFLILSPSMNSLFGIMDFNPRELAIFTHLRNLYFLKSIVNSISPGRRALYPREVFLYDLQREQYSVYVSINPHQVENNVTGLDYQRGRRENTDRDGSTYETSVYHQFGKANPWKRDVNSDIQRNLFQHLKDFNKGNPELVEQVTWSYYFPNFPPEAITEGALWDVLDMQGMYNTWYIGSSVSFESIESVFEYNHLLMKLFF
ncbi:uncharacterized protein LOC130053007 [Ostrea edulis]|nr:uncharacterized protein LOC130053007 [Ostrea edulis]